jgi:hypothetical protein
MKRILLSWDEGAVLMKRQFVPAGEAPGRHLVEAAREVWRLLKRGVDFPADWQSPLQSELRELAAPHLAVLVHKRAKLVQALRDERWAGELSDFVGRILWPHLSSSETLVGRSQNCVAELLDEIVAAEQNAVAAQAEAIPLTSRFDTNWAT